MESHLAAQDSAISSAFVHKIGNTADWATSKHEVKWYNSGGNSFSPNGVKVIRFDLTCSASQMLDPLSCILQFTVTNNSYDGTVNKNLHMATLANAFFRRVTIKCGGVTVSDEDYANRFAHMMMQFAPKAQKDNLAIMAGETGTIIENEKTFGIPILAPIFQQTKMLPLSFMSLQISLELVDSATDVLMKDSDLPAGVTGQGSSWVISEPVVMGSLTSLDTQLSNEFSDLLLRGKTLSIPVTGSYTFPTVITNGAGGFNIAMTRSLSRLSKIYQTFSSNANSKYVSDMEYPALSATANMEWQGQIGATRFPQWGALKTIPEYWWNLQQAIGTHQSAFHTNAIELTDYLTDSFVVGLNLEKVSSDNADDVFSGLSTKMGDLATFRTKNVSTSVDTCWTTMQYSMIVQISEAGVEVFD